MQNYAISLFYLSNDLTQPPTVAMILRWLLALSTLYLTPVSSNRFQTDAVNENIEKGKHAYEEFKDNSKSGKSSGCWAGAIEDLEESCENLTEETMSRLAYSFLTCHLQQHKRKIHVCNDNADIDRLVNLLWLSQDALCSPAPNR